MSDTKMKILHKIFLLTSTMVVLYGVTLTVTYDGYVDFSTLAYFSIISNLLVAVAFIVRFAIYNKASVFRQYLLSSALLSISITGLVYNFVLVPFGGAAIVFSDFGNFVIHLLAIVLSLVNHFCFEEKSKFTLKHILVGTLLPIIYWVFFVSFGDAIGFYPYFFLNPLQIGWFMVFVWLGVMLIGFVLLAFSLTLISKHSRLAATVAIVFCLLLSTSFVSCTTADVPSSIEVNDHGIPEEGLRFATGVSLYVNLEGNYLVIQTHEDEDILIKVLLSSHSVYMHPIYEFDQSNAHLSITDEQRGRRRVGKNSSDPSGTVTIFVPQNLAADEIFSYLDISAGYVHNFTAIVLD